MYPISFIHVTTELLAPGEIGLSHQTSRVLGPTSFVSSCLELNQPMNGENLEQALTLRGRALYALRTGTPGLGVESSLASWAECGHDSLGGRHAGCVVKTGCVEKAERLSTWGVPVHETPPVPCSGAVPGPTQPPLSGLP